MTKRLIKINLTAVLVIAFGLTTFIHELAHALAAKMMGVPAKLFHTYVSFDNSHIPANDEIVILASGPLVSFFQALLFFVLLKTKSKLGLWGWFYVWMTIIGMVVFLGYLMMGPFVPYGDTGKIYSLLGTPSSLSHSIAGVALFGIILFFKQITPYLMGFLIDLKVVSRYDHTNVLFHFLIIPLLLGTVLNTLNSLPAPTAVSLAFPVFLPLTLIPTLIRLRKSAWRSDIQADVNSMVSASYWPLISVLLLMLFFRVLTIGIEI